MPRDWAAVAAPWAVAAALALVGAWIVVAQPVAFDDAWITYRYAENWLAGRGLVFDPGSEPVEGYSNPLWLLFSALAMAMGVEPYAATRFLGAGSYLVAIAAVGGGLAQHARALGPAGAALVPALGCLFLPAGLGAISGSGLETGFAGLCLVSLGLSLLLRGRSRWTGLICVVVPLVACATRLDLLIGVIAVSLADLVGERAKRLPDVRRRALQRWVPLSVLLAAMFGFRWSYYGAWLPNPYWAKGADEWHLVAGASYWWGFLRSAWQVIPLAGLAVFGALSARSWRLRRLCLYSLLCFVGYGLYVAKVGGDFMQYRFAWPPYLALSAGGLAGLSELARRQVAPAALLGVAIGSLSALPPVLEHEYAMQSLAEMDDYTRLGLEVGPALDEALPAGTRVATTLAGTLSFGSSLHIIDQWGLNDREVAQGESLPVFQRGHYKPATEALLRARGVELVIHHPQVCACDDLCLEDAPMLFVRLDATRCLQGFLLSPGQELIDRVCSAPDRFVLHGVHCGR